MHAIRTGLSPEECATEVLTSVLIGPGNENEVDSQISDGSIVEPIKGLEGKGFTDDGAKAYTIAARDEFHKFAKRKGLDLQEALNELSDIALKYQGNFEKISRILMGQHVLTGDEMAVEIQETGCCPMQKTLQEWTGNKLHSLCKVFVDAIDA